MRYARTAAAGALVGLVAAEDAVIWRTDLPVPVLGPMDWAGHLATAAVALLALGPRDVRPHARTVGVIAVSSVAIDLDHVPMYLHLVSGVDGGRPVTHSLLTPAVLLLGGVTTRRYRQVLTAAAAGVGLHFVRDIATGPGISLFAPYVDRPTRVPWSAYAAVLAGLTTIVFVRDTLTAARPPAGAAPRRVPAAGRRLLRARSRSAAAG